MNLLFNENGTFICGGYGDILKWIFDGVILKSWGVGIIFTDPGGPGNLSSTLTDTALSVYHRKTISCQIIEYPSKQVFSNTCRLTIRGWFVCVALCVSVVVVVVCVCFFVCLCVCVDV